MESSEIRHVRVGDWALLDALYGPERVLEVTHLALPVLPGSNIPYGYEIEVAHLHVTDDRDVHRWVVRGLHEPVLRISYKDRAFVVVPSPVDHEREQG